MEQAKRARPAVTLRQLEWEGSAEPEERCLKLVPAEQLLLAAAWHSVVRAASVP